MRQNWSQRVRFRQLTTTALLMMSSGTALASSHGPENAAINWWGLGSQYADNPAVGWYTITFVLFVFGLIHYTRRPLGLYLEARSREISQAINEAKRAKEDALAQLAVSEQQLKDLDSEVAAMRGEFLAQGEAEKKRLARETAQLTARISAETAATIRAETTRMSAELRAELSSAIIERARQKISNGEPSMEDALRKDFVKDIATFEH